MDPHLVLTRPSQLAAGRLRVGFILFLLGVVAITVVLTGGASLLLVGSVVAGAGLTYWTGLPLTLEERLAYGTVAGALVVALVMLLLAMAFGLSLPTVLAGLAISLTASATGWWRGRPALSGELADLRRRWGRGEPWPLWLLLGVCWPFTLLLLAQSYTFTGQGLITGNPGAYADWAAHLSYAGSFAYGANYPPEFPIAPGHALSYPFLIDFLAAALVPLGTSLTSSLVLTSGLLALAFPAVMYLAGARLLGSRGAAALAVPVFLLSGGLGFVFFFADLAHLGPGALLHLPRLYTQDGQHNYQWLNPVLAWVIPQRSVLFGFSLALLSLTLLWTAIAQRAGWRAFAAIGSIVGLAPLAHLHGYATVVTLAACWAFLSPRREWLAFFVPALALGLPVVLWLLGGGAAHPRIQVWWMADSGGNHDGPVWFWLKNTGLLVPAMAAAFAWPRLLPPGVARHLAPIWLWFLVPNFIVFQPWDWDNTKFFAYWALIGALPVGALLAALLTRGWAARSLAVALAAVLMLAGGLDLARTLDRSASSALFTDAGGIQVAEWVRSHTAPRAIFLVAPEHNQPVAALGGRRIVAGYPGWLWTYGPPDWFQRTQDAERMLRGDPATPELARAYGVDYVVLGPQELNGHGASASYWDQHARQVYASRGYTVYRLR